MNAVKIAVDSMPLGNDLATTYDYSGYQVFGLTETTLGDLPRTVKPNEVRVSVTDVTSHAGDRVSAKDYLEGMRELIKSHPFAKKVLFRDLSGLTLEDEGLVIRCKSRNRMLSKVLSIPNLCPRGSKKEGGSGPYGFAKKNSQYVIKKRKGTLPDFPDEIVFSHVKSPENNLKQYENGDIDITADTAFLFEERVSASERKDFTQRDTGLLFQFTFSKNLSLKSRASLKAIVQNTNYSSIFRAYYSPCFDYHGGSVVRKNGIYGSAHGRLITLAYDEYYPNREICQVAREQLQNHGYEVSLVKDSFEKPYQAYDIKLEIHRGLGSDPYFRYASFLLNPNLYVEREAWHAYFQLIASLEQSESLEEERSHHQSLQKVLDDCAISAPIAKLPSCFFSNLKNAFNPAVEAVTRERLSR